MTRFMPLSSAEVKDAAKRLARRAGLDVRLYQPRNSVEARRARWMSEIGTTLVLDVGANRGQYGSMLRSQGYTGRIVSFEPLQGPYAALSATAAGDSQWTTINAALGAVSSVQAMNVSSATPSSSLLDAEDHAFHLPESTRFVATQTISVRRLDELADELMRDDDQTYLKLDVQGYELAAIQGASSVLERVSAVEVELSLVALYKNQPLYRDVLDVLGTEGFSVFSLEPAFFDQTSGRLLQMDAICIREP